MDLPYDVRTNTTVSHGELPPLWIKVRKNRKVRTRTRFQCNTFDLRQRGRLLGFQREDHVLFSSDFRASPLDRHETSPRESLRRFRVRQASFDNVKSSRGTRIKHKALLIRQSGADNQGIVCMLMPTQKRHLHLSTSL